MAEIIGEISLDQVVSLKAIRAELILIARALIAHATLYRPLRLVFQREAHSLPALRRMAKHANKKLAAFDVIPWLKHALRRSERKAKPEQLGLMIFGPILIHIQAQDRGDAAFGIADIESFLPAWADHWAEWFEPGGKA
ncbi:MAG TPA: hypothetical protein VGG69_10965 [Rhizomicrobium sp.]